jgi:sigma-B regulation protein RsbU (phosphoserine phosphatase)
MLTGVLSPLLREYRTRPAARFAVWVLAYGLTLWLVGRFSKAPNAVPTLLWVLFWLCFLPLGGYYIIRLVGFVKGRLLWRLGRRLIVAYIFIAVVPIILILRLAVYGASIIGGQFAAFLVASRIREQFAELRQFNRAVILEAHMTRETSPDEALNHLQKFYQEELIRHAAAYPGLEITLNLNGKTRSFLLDGRLTKRPLTVPRWFLRDEFAGVVLDQGELALRSIERTQTLPGKLTIILSLPVTPELLDVVGTGIGSVGVVTTRGEKGPPDKTAFRFETSKGDFVQAASIRSKSLRIPPSTSFWDLAVDGASSLDPISWEGETEQTLPQPIFVLVSSRLVTLSRQLFSALGQFSQSYVILFKVVAIIFMVIEVISLIIGVRMTRTMTRTVDRLYDATERIKKGDFSYRIGLPAHDQLTALGESFDSMTASVERLLRESQEKSRLESELEIARQVQSQLFPRSAPDISGLRLYGVCKAARSVSGDYYDFLELGENRVGLVLGDVSGKGISAALVMAAIQSALRAQFYNGYSQAAHSESSQVSTAQIVARLNRQLYESTPAEKYVTFFYGVYDGTTRKLTYTNAGHLPPVLFRNGEVVRLRTGGTVVGLFTSVRFEEEEIQLQPGDVLLAYTDGITEPENSYGEEFGEERVLEVAKRALAATPELLVDEIYRSVSDWTGSPELQDDMTLIVAKADFGS